jgi:hypothetical protein
VKCRRRWFREFNQVETGVTAVYDRHGDDLEKAPRTIHAFQEKSWGAIATPMSELDHHLSPPRRRK